MAGIVILVYTFFQIHIRHNLVKKNMKTKSFLYKNFGKNGAEAGSGRIVAKKHGREVRHTVFQIASAGVKNGCFAVALLVGRSYLQQDTHYTKLKKTETQT